MSHQLLEEAASSCYLVSVMDATQERLARRLFWWKAPEEALANQNRFLAQVMTYGTWGDIVEARNYWESEAWREALRKAPPGVFDARSWVYWHHALEMLPIGPLPARTLPDGA